MSNVSELACTYATLILHDEGIPITAEKIATLVKSANVKVESYWPVLFAKLASNRNLDDLILHVGSAGGASASATAAGPAGAGTPAAAVVEENKKEEPMEESEDENMFDLFAE